MIVKSMKLRVMYLSCFVVQSNQSLYLYILLYQLSTLVKWQQPNVYYIYKYTNLPVSDRVRLSHPRSGNSQGQETFLARFADPREFWDRSGKGYPFSQKVQTQNVPVKYS